MKVVSSLTSPDVVDCLMTGGIVVARTDTLYGVLASANDEAAVERVYALKDRNEHKSSIVLISNRQQLHEEASETATQLMDEYWPGPVSIIMPTLKAPLWLRRGNDSVAYRMPDHDDLRRLIDQTGPLIAPSANPEGYPPAMDIQQALEYFGGGVGVYVDGEEVVDAAPSTLLTIDDSGTVKRLR